MDFGDVVAIVEAVALAGSWMWLQSKKLSYPGWKRKAALAALGCASLAVGLDLVLTGIMHWTGVEHVGENLYLGFFAAILIFSFLSAILSLLGRGSPRILALVWSLVLILQGAVTIAIGMSQE